VLAAREGEKREKGIVFWRHFLDDDILEHR
jgi:hypothetical protein